MGIIAQHPHNFIKETAVESCVNAESNSKGDYTQDSVIIEWIRFIYQMLILVAGARSLARI